MNAANTSFHYTSNNYAGNVARAARNLLAAVFAVQPKQAAEVSAKEKAATRSFLQRMAADYVSHAPSMAAELQYLANRD
ncbi:hypothetical protein ACLB1G_24110 [Oxalobacteraceae bacterium A2-2]